MKSISSIKRTIATLAVVAMAFAPTIGRAAQLDPCGGEQGGTGHGSDLCATGPAGCVAVGVRVEIAPNIALPFGATVELSRSTAMASGSGGYGYSHGDAHQAKATIPATLGAGAVESSCNAFSKSGSNAAWGDADVSQLYLSLYPYSVPVTLSADVLHEYGSSFNGAGGNTANIENFFATVNGSPVGPFNTSAGVNETHSLGPLGTLYLNEQRTSFSPCPEFHGDALRLDITDPATGLLVARVIISWVSTSTCP